MAADVALAFQTWRHVMSPMAASEATAFGAIRVDNGLAAFGIKQAISTIRSAMLPRLLGDQPVGWSPNRPPKRSISILQDRSAWHFR